MLSVLDDHHTSYFHSLYPLTPYQEHSGLLFIDNLDNNCHFSLLSLLLPF